MKVRTLFSLLDNFVELKFSLIFWKNCINPHLCGISKVFRQWSSMSNKDHSSSRIFQWSDRLYHQVEANGVHLSIPCGFAIYLFIKHNFAGMFLVLDSFKFLDTIPNIYFHWLRPCLARYEKKYPRQHEHDLACWSIYWWVSARKT